MLTKKSIGIALGAALALGASGAAFAVPTYQTVDGITWDTSSPLNLKIQGDSLRETVVENVGDVLTGYGRISSINGDNGNFCDSCSLTFTFSYTVKQVNGNQVVFDNGTLDLWADSTGSFNETDPSTAGVGDHWLSLTGHNASYLDFTTTGQLFSNISGSIARPGDASSGFGMLDVLGGDAAAWVARDVYKDGLGGFSDMTLTSSFSFQDAGVCGTINGQDASHCFPIAGTGTMLNQMLPVSVPEPAEIGMLGLGLGVLGFMLRRRRKEEADELS